MNSVLLLSIVRPFQLSQSTTRVKPSAHLVFTEWCVAPVASMEPSSIYEERDLCRHHH